MFEESVIFCIYDKTVEHLRFFIDYHLALGFTKIEILNHTKQDLSKIIEGKERLILLNPSSNKDLESLINQEKKTKFPQSYSLVLKVNQFFHYQYSEMIKLNEFLEFCNKYYTEDLLSYRVEIAEPKDLFRVEANTSKLASEDEPARGTPPNSSLRSKILAEESFTEKVFDNFTIDFDYMHKALSENKTEKVWLKSLTKETHKLDPIIKRPTINETNAPISIVFEIKPVLENKNIKHQRSFLNQDEVFDNYLKQIFITNNSYEKYYENKILDNVKLKDYKRKYIKNTQELNNDYQKFVIIGLARTGTNLLCSFLHHSDEVCCAGEIFNKSRTLIGTQTVSDAVLNIYKKISPLYFLSNILWHNNYSQRIKAVGYKALREHIQNYPILLESIYKNKDVKVIFCKRRNYLARIYSEKIAALYDQWFITSEEKRIKKKIYISSSECKKLFNFDKNFYDTITTNLQKNKIEYIDLYYEDFNNDINGELNKITNFINIEDIKQPQTHLKKQNVNKLEDVIENYNKLKEYFQNTQWESFFKAS